MLPSTALVTAPFSETSSALSALTVQAVRERTCPVAPSRLISAAEVQGPPFTSESAPPASRRTRGPARRWRRRRRRPAAPDRPAELGADRRRPVGDAGPDEIRPRRRRAPRDDAGCRRIDGHARREVRRSVRQRPGSGPRDLKGDLRRDADGRVLLGHRGEPERRRRPDAYVPRHRQGSPRRRARTACRAPAAPSPGLLGTSTSVDVGDRSAWNVERQPPLIVVDRVRRRPTSRTSANDATRRSVVTVMVVPWFAQVGALGRSSAARPGCRRR